MTVGEKVKTTIILINTINFYIGKRNFNMYLYFYRSLTEPKENMI